MSEIWHTYLNLQLKTKINLKVRGNENRTDGSHSKIPITSRMLRDHVQDAPRSRPGSHPSQAGVLEVHILNNANLFKRTFYFAFILHFFVYHKVYRLDRILDRHGAVTIQALVSRHIILCDPRLSTPWCMISLLLLTHACLKR